VYEHLVAIDVDHPVLRYACGGIGGRLPEIVSP